MTLTFESGCLIVLLLTAPFLVAAFSRLGRRHHSLLHAVVRERWNSRIRSGIFFRGDRIEIGVDDIPGEITYSEYSGKGGSTSLSGWTRVRFSWPSDRRLRVAPEGIASRLRRLFGGTEVQFDDPPFDDRFWIESSHPTWSRSILDPSTRRGLVKLRFTPTGPEPHDVTLDLGPAGLTLRVSACLLNDADVLASFVELAIAILQKARGLVETAGVTLEAVHARAGSACPVCGHAVDLGKRCPRCRTPHHEDCWTYAGGCAIFGCGGRLRKAA